jgi:hypothetical protein
MSIHPRFDNPTSVNSLNTAPIVLRFASMFPRDLARRNMHDKRTGGDLSHVRTDLSGLNTQLIGEADWIAQLHTDIALARDNNLEEEITARQRKGRHLEAEEVRARGTVDPWKFTRDGPLREGILTVNKLWFGGTGHENWDSLRVEAFKKRGLEFLKRHFPDGQLRHVSIHEDEEAVHFHFVIAVWVEKTSQNRGRQWLLQPSANPLLANYEHAQDLAGEAFADLGIHRGERRAAAARHAMAAGFEAPEPRRHVPPSEWRREQRLLALQERDRICAEARAEADATIADGMVQAEAEVKKSRKRAIKEAKAKRAELDRQIAAAERARAQEKAHAAASRLALDAAEATRVTADQYAADKMRIADAAEVEAAQTKARADALAAGLIVLSRETAAETLHRTAEGEIIADDPDALRAAGPEIVPAVHAAVKLVETSKSIRHELNDAANTTIQMRNDMLAEVADMQATARAEIAQERDAARLQIEAERQAVADQLERESTQMAGYVLALQSLFNKIEPLLTRLMRWLSHPDLPATLQKEGRALAADAYDVMNDFRQNNPNP